MADITQAEADFLFHMEKFAADNKTWYYPTSGGSVAIPLRSYNNQETFLLDISRSGNIQLKGKYQNRARQAIILVRLDVGASPHRNPDGEEIECPHIHIYRELYDDKWAFPVNKVVFRNVDDRWQTLEDFMRFCSVVSPPIFNRGLFDD